MGLSIMSCGRECLNAGGGGEVPSTGSPRNPINNTSGIENWVTKARGINSFRPLLPLFLFLQNV
jgi:hypothetical protein